MRPIRVILLAVLLAPSAHPFGDSPDFPYQANVGSDNVLVRSGPGGRYYPTGRLAAGDRVTVHRHDPGGWFMVSPPEGSFSWIPAHGVTISGSQGTITALSLPVQVGSRFDETDRNVTSRELSRGETVTIIGRGQDAAGNPLLKIAPPRLEFRWVSGGVLATLTNPTPDQRVKKTTDRKIRTASIQDTRQGTSEITYEKTPIDKRAYETLKTLDATFGRIAGGPPAGWSFDQLEADYRKLMASTRVPGFGSLVRRRLAAVTRYRTRQQTLNEIQALAESTNRRDTAIRQAGHQVSVPAQPAARPTPLPRPRPRPVPVPRFSGAGIVRPVGTRHPSLPSFVLVAPDGKLLAFLRPAAGINLAAWVNRSVGLTGARHFDRDLQSDLLVVRSLQAVRLR
jgi:uncharacterized protein YgiM (DUF1202 family)